MCPCCLCPMPQRGREGRGRRCDLHPTAHSATTLVMPLETALLCLDPFRGALRPKVCIFCFLLPPVYQRKDESGRLCDAVIGAMPGSGSNSHLFPFFPNFSTMVVSEGHIRSAWSLRSHSQVPIRQVWTISCVLTGSLASCRQH